ncbi:transposase, partial [Mesorhizobium sp. M0306]|uniref:IS66 family transposase n=1 Tax=Mesorhizobium sp. M0306 TaxID=2956932 RepID=UPI00333883AB
MSRSRGALHCCPRFSGTTVPFLRNAHNRFLYDGQLEPDNLIAERAIRGFTVGRRNWLFSGSFAAAERSAVVLSIIET